MPIDREDEQLWFLAKALEREYQTARTALDIIRRQRQNAIIGLAQCHTVPDIARGLGLSEATVWRLFYHDYSSRKPGRPKKKQFYSDEATWNDD